jgi:hypothetical protein
MRLGLAIPTTSSSTSSTGTCRYPCTASTQTAEATESDSETTEFANRSIVPVVVALGKLH